MAIPISVVPPLMELGEAMRSLIRRQESRQGCEVVLDIYDVQIPLLPKSTVDLLLCILERCLHNSREHSLARYIHVLLKYRAGILELAVIDDGKTFDELPGGEEGGLADIRLLATRIQACIHLESDKHGGKRLSVFFSFPEATVQK